MYLFFFTLNILTYLYICIYITLHISTLLIYVFPYSPPCITMHIHFYMSRLSYINKLTRLYTLVELRTHLTYIYLFALTLRITYIIIYMYSYMYTSTLVYYINITSSGRSRYTAIL